MVLLVTSRHPFIFLGGHVFPFIFASRPVQWFRGFSNVMEQFMAHGYELEFMSQRSAQLRMSSENHRIECWRIKLRFPILTKESFNRSRENSEKTFSEKNLRIAFAQFFYFRKKDYITCRDFYFLPSSIFFLEQKVTTN